jgi:hypothetical protein
VRFEVLTAVVLRTESSQILQCQLVNSPDVSLNLTLYLSNIAYFPEDLSLQHLMKFIILCSPCIPKERQAEKIKLDYTL